MRRWPRLRVTVAVVALALVLAACSGDDAEDKPRATPPASDAQRGGGGGTPGDAGQLPPKFMECMADQGFPIKSLDEVHSAPQQVLQTCFGALHGGP